MREATGRGATTIAKFLREAEEGKIALRREPLVIIDEASMLDLPMVFDIVPALPDEG